MGPERLVHCRAALLPTGWASDVEIAVGEDGRIRRVTPGVRREAGGSAALGPAVPGMVDLHSHSFQRAMAGLAEVAGPADDSFWSWREAMYALAGRLTPQDVAIISRKLYIELLLGGFTRVAEFHYLHRPGGTRRLGDPARGEAIETSRGIVGAAQEAGIGLTHLPVFYARSNFGGAPPSPGQAPFVHDVDGFLRLVEELGPVCAEAGAGLGIAIHSLRAASADEMRAVLAGDPAGGPIHIHVAEQEREVADCLAATGARPVDWLLDGFPVDRRWCLVHATQVTDAETARLAASQAVVGLCPATEANLGDGIFPATAFRAAGGRFGIGTDSHVATSVDEELRLLEYGQRLRDRLRARMATGEGSSVGRTLFDGAFAGGRQAAGLPAAGIEAGAPADLVILDDGDPFIGAARGDAILDRWIFAVGRAAVRDVMVGGRWVVRGGVHEGQAEATQAFAALLAALRDGAPAGGRTSTSTSTGAPQ